VRRLAGAAVILTNLVNRCQVDLIFADRNHSEELDALWPTAVAMIATLGDPLIEMEVNVEEEDLIRLALDAGFEASEALNRTCWIPASDCPKIPPLRSDLTLHSRAESRCELHPMIGRNGEALAQRLFERSLYNPVLDLAVYSSHDEVAGYTIFWADPVTRVGLVEAMRTEGEFPGHGIARHMLVAGHDRLVRSGCQRLKVSSGIRLHQSAGFLPTSQSVTLSRSVLVSP